jgi:hypothetical protein
MRKYFYTDGVNRFGPFSKEDLKAQKISRNTKVWYYGLDRWKEIKEVSELGDILSGIPPDLKKENKSITNQIELADSRYSDNSGAQLKLNKSNTGKWVIGVMVLLVVTLIAIAVARKQSEASLYDEIVAISYDADENFDMYVEKFYRDLEVYGIFPTKPKSTIIKFARLDQLAKTTHIHALSFGHNDDNRIEIYINPSSWQQFSKPMRYFLMYHELAHDILNLDDLKNHPINEGKLMYPEISGYDNKTMDDFIESFHSLFEQESKNDKTNNQ